jgi:exodeoxyribonuclease VII large subunit
VSGVGHETDFSISDFVADLRAPTPTAAAAAASPDRENLCAQVAQVRRRLGRDIRRAIEVGSQRLDGASRRLLTPAERLARSRERVSELARRLTTAWDREQHLRGLAIATLGPRLRRALQGALRERAQRLGALRTALSHLDPTQVLERGYSIVRDAGGHVRVTSAGLARGDPLDITFSEGDAAVTVRDPR